AGPAIEIHFFAAVTFSLSSLGTGFRCFSSCFFSASASFQARRAATSGSFASVVAIPPDEGLPRRCPRSADPVLPDPLALPPCRPLPAPLERGRVPVPVACHRLEPADDLVGVGRALLTQRPALQHPL